MRRRVRRTVSISPRSYLTLLALTAELNRSGSSMVEGWIDAKAEEVGIHVHEVDVAMFIAGARRRKPRYSMELAKLDALMREAFG